LDTLFNYPTSFAHTFCLAATQKPNGKAKRVSKPKQFCSTFAFAQMSRKIVHPLALILHFKTDSVAVSLHRQ